ncbi:hypothetical protein [Gemmatimonas groenlandica]|uniref:Uncharacterized protein n=1 Tax=Gemmatimonas groenlandica TaxID=2732249 RepID=A0A6M4IV75_9BACT|nr:hypothetical protein [Gemmatimonas groenlandica]QJR37497.1 hypothetical protein HKW67_19260 [Gemmatimonas groenlandica]
MWMALSGLVARNASPTTNRRPRYALRTDAVGCWAFADVPGSGQGMQLAQSPILVKLDTSPLRVDIPGTRVVDRLDGAGQPLRRVVEGLGLSDVWTADALSDRIQVRFSNGLYASTWALQLPSGGGRVDTIRGQSEEFGGLSLRA